MNYFKQNDFSNKGKRLKTQTSILIGLILASTVSYSKTLTYKCSYSQMQSNQPISVAIDTKSQKPIFIGTVSPADSRLPKITLELGYDFHILHGVLLKSAMYKPALLATSGTATTAIYGEIGQTLAMAYSSGELLDDGVPRPGGAAVTSEFDVVCEPVK